MLPTGLWVLQGHPGWGTALEILDFMAENSSQMGQQLLSEPKAAVLDFQSHLSDGLGWVWIGSTSSPEP